MRFTTRPSGKQFPHASPPILGPRPLRHLLPVKLSRIAHHRTPDGSTDDSDADNDIKECSAPAFQPSNTWLIECNDAGKDPKRIPGAAERQGPKVA